MYCIYTHTRILVFTVSSNHACTVECERTTSPVRLLRSRRGGNSLMRLLTHASGDQGWTAAISSIPTASAGSLPFVCAANGRFVNASIRLERRAILMQLTKMTRRSMRHRLVALAAAAGGATFEGCRLQSTLRHGAANEAAGTCPATADAREKSATTPEAAAPSLRSRAAGAACRRSELRTSAASPVRSPTRDGAVCR
jgi:hypothetical protein